MDTTLATLVDAVREAGAARTPLFISGGGSKRFYGLALPAARTLDVRPHAGIVDYEPTELVVTARCGTPLAELEAILAERGQMLAFEPPHFGGQSERQPPHFAGNATLGGAVAAGLSGPRRQAAGAVRDFVLGARVLDGRGEVLSFGGQVMKNVAGYDVSRLMAGSMGTLGVILEASLKTLPRPVAEATLRFDMNAAQAIATLNRWGGQPLPLSASCWTGGVLTVRLSGAAAAVHSARQKLGGETLDDGAAFWRGVRDQSHDFFSGSEPLWRMSLPSVTPATALDGAAGGQLMEWGGALRWLKSDAPAAALRGIAAKAGGHATLFRAADEQRERDGVFQPLPPALLQIHRNLKAGFDPLGILCPGRMYREL